jgi:hypothetical protein
VVFPDAPAALLPGEGIGESEVPLEHAAAQLTKTSGGSQRRAWPNETLVRNIERASI